MMINSNHSSINILYKSGSKGYATVPKWLKSTLLALLLVKVCFAQSVTPRIKLNQLGFYPNVPKVAIVTGDISANNFYITSTNLRDTFFTGTLGAEKKSAYSTTKTRTADFSSLTKKGSFVVLVNGIGHSYVFEVGDDANKQAAVSTIKGYYFQRASMPLEEKYAGKWHRSAGHPDDVVYIHPSAATKERPEGTVISSPGWLVRCRRLQQIYCEFRHHHGHYLISF